MTFIIKVFIFCLNVIYLFFKLFKKRNQITLISRQSNKLTQDFKLLKEELEKLQEVSGYTVERAKQELLDVLEEEMAQEKANKIREFEAKTKEDSEKIARNIIGFAIQKCAADHTSETTVSAAITSVRE